MPTDIPSKAEFHDALARVFAKVKRASKDRNNPAFKSRYATLAAVCDACEDALNEHEFAYPQEAHTVVSDTSVECVVETVLLWKGHEYRSGKVTIPLARNATAQQIGSAFTYARRYSLSATLAVCPDDDDDDGNAASKAARHPREHAPEPDPALERLHVATQALAAKRRILDQQAQDLVCAAADTWPAGPPTPREIAALTKAAQDLLDEPVEAPRERAAVKGEQTTESSKPAADPYTVAVDAFAAAGKAYLERRAADYLDAECRSPDQGLLRSFRERAVAIACEAIGTKTWPGDAATTDQLTRAAAALLAIPVPTKASPKMTPRDEWNAAREAFLDAREADYRREEGAPDADVLAKWSADVLAISAKIVGVAKWPARPSTEQWLDAAMALRAAGGAK